MTQKENELNAEYDERMRNYEERWVISSAVEQQLTRSKGEGSAATGSDGQESNAGPSHLE